MEEYNPFSEIKSCDRYRDLLYLFLLATLLSLLFSLAGIFVSNKLLKADLNSTEIISFMQGLVYTLLCLRVLKDRGVDLAAAWRDWRAGAGRDALTTVKYCGLYLIIIGAMIGSVMALARFTSLPDADLVRRLGVRSEMYSAARAAMDMSYIRSFFLFFSFCVLAPLGEELLFRRIIYVTLRKKIGFLRALFASSVIFAATHGTASLLVFPISLLLGYVYEKERRLPVNIMLHAFINLFVMGVRLT